MLVGVDIKKVLCSGHCKKGKLLWIEMSVKNYEICLYIFLILDLQELSQTVHREYCNIIFLALCYQNSILDMDEEWSGRQYYLFHLRRRGFYRVQALLARQRFFGAPFRPLHSTVYTFSSLFLQDVYSLFVILPLLVFVYSGLIPGEFTVQYSIV